MAVTPDILLLILLMLLSAAAGYGLGCARTRRLLRAASEKQTEATVDRLPYSADAAAAEEGDGIPWSASNIEPAPVGVETQAVAGAVADPSARASGSAGAVAACVPSPTLRLTGAGEALGAGNPLPDPPADAEKDPQDVPSRVCPAAPVPHRARQAPKRAQQRDSEDPPGAARPLMQIRGIGPRLEAALAAQGITSLEQVANWSAEDAARMGEAVRAPGRPQREDWSGQARRLLALAADAPPVGHFFPQEPASVAPDVELEGQSGLLFPELASAPRTGRRRRRSP